MTEGTKKGQLKGDWAAIFGKQSPQSTVKQLAFVLERRNKSREYIASWRTSADEISEGLTRLFSSQRKLDFQCNPMRKSKTTVQVNLCLDADETSKDMQPHASVQPNYDARRETGGISMLQSHLQKCVRRGMGILAAQTARELAAIRFGSNNLIGLDMLLRRLPIIIVEDVFPLQDLIAPLVWFMLAATRGKTDKVEYQLTEADLSFILGCAVAASRYPLGPDHHANSYLNSLPSPSTGIYTLQMSLLARAAYGGMSDDVRLLLRVAADQDALRKGSKLQVTPISAISLQRLSPADWLLTGVDYHVSQAKILKLMRSQPDSKYISEIHDDDIKKWMWRTRSSINFRFELSEDDDGVATSRKRQRTASFWWFVNAHLLANSCAKQMIQSAYKGANK